MQQVEELFNISKKVWQSFSSDCLLEVDFELNQTGISTLQWFYCHLSANAVVLLGIDFSAGYQLASDMLDIKKESITEEDELDAMVELMNCICGQLDKDHPSNDCFERPKQIQPKEILILLRSLNKLSEVTARAGENLFYIALFQAKDMEKYGALG